MDKIQPKLHLTGQFFPPKMSLSLPKRIKFITTLVFSTGNHIQQVKEAGHIFINVFSTENINYMR